MKSALLCLAFVLGLAACEDARSNDAPATNTAALSEGADDLAVIIRGGGQCGRNTCSAGTYCCNASCGTCAPFGSYCTQQICPDTELTDEPAPQADQAADDCAQDLLAAGGSCGGVTCPKGTWCCNASCGRCVPIGMQCTQEAC